MTMPQKLSGGCACGAIRYECDADPVIMMNCHCRDCQKGERQRLRGYRCGAERCCSDSRGAALPQSCCSERQSDPTRVLPKLRQPNNLDVGTEARCPRIAGGELGRSIDLPTHNGCIHLQLAAVGSHGSEGAKAF